jgi:hypothetical protein
MGAHDENPDDRQMRLALEALTRKLAAGLGQTLKEILPPGFGFALMLFDFGDTGSFAYASNADREDFLRLLDEAKEKLGGGG